MVVFYHQKSIWKLARKKWMFFKYFNKETVVLEFGCGLGKNLFGIADRIKYVYEIDINSFI